MEKDKVIAKYSIKDEKFRNLKFTIPLYQREYAWQSEEVLTLIEDLSQAEGKSYYIGNIVIDANCNVIDGQQRLTTLYLMLMIMDKDLLFDLNYEIRDEDNNFLKAQDPENLSLCKNENMRENLQIIKDRCRAQEFKKESLEKICFTVTTLPHDTDITRYFELINSRGVQLEKNQILKAKFISAFQDESARNRFAKIWEYCSMMDYFLRDISTFEDHRNTDEKFQDFLKNNSLPSFFDKEYNGMNFYEIINKKNQYKSIISFDYLLLHALHCFQKEKEDSGEKLDFKMSDLNLLNIFDKEFSYKADETIKINQFIFYLLKFRIIFDYFVFKRDLDSRHFFQEIQEKNLFTIVNPKKLKMIQLLFYFTAENFKSQQWIQEVFHFTMEEINNPQSSSGGLSEKLIEKLEEIDREKARKKKEESIDFLNQGTSTPHYWFYRLEYLLWKKAKDYDDLKDIENEYTLMRLNSIEHIQPQSKSNESGFNSETIDEFGNLALLSISRNSSLGNLPVNEKKAKIDTWIHKKEKIQSLKMILALRHNNWSYEASKKHGENMKKLLLEDLQEDEDDTLSC